MVSGDDEVEIRSGGAIAVDPDAMRAAAGRMHAVCDTLDRAVAAIARARQAIDGSTLPMKGDFSGLAVVQGGLGEQAEKLAAAAAASHLMADAFELAELRARQQMLGVGSPVTAAGLQLRIDELAASGWPVTMLAGFFAAGWEGDRYDGTRMPWEVALLGDAAPVAWGAQALSPMLATIGASLNIAFPAVQRQLMAVVNGLGRGVIPPGTRLSPNGRATPTIVRQLPVPQTATAPKTLKDALQRVPATSPAQVRIEKYTMSDGSRRFRIYLDGTQKALKDPWNMPSNLDLYLLRNESASSAAVREAMRQAGVRPGDTLDLVAYSQSGLIGADLAMSGEYDVRTFVSVGSPSEPTLGDETQVVQLRHNDDPIGNGLSGNGSPGTTGSDDSFIARRDAGGFDETPSLDDLRMMDPHFIDSYLDTAGLVDESGDPRVDALHENMREYDDATDVETFLFCAEFEKD